MPRAVYCGQESCPASLLLLYPIQTRMCRKLISVSHICTVKLDVMLWTFDKLLWPEASNVPHICLPRPASLNSKGFEEVHIVQLSDCQSSCYPQTSHMIYFLRKVTGMLILLEPVYVKVD